MTSLSQFETCVEYKSRFVLRVYAYTSERSKLTSTAVTISQWSSRAIDIQLAVTYKWTKQQMLVTACRVTCTRRGMLASVRRLFVALQPKLVADGACWQWRWRFSSGNTKKFSSLSRVTNFVDIWRRCVWFP